MANFAAIAFLDPFHLIASLPRRMGLFKGEPGELKRLPIRSLRGEEYRNVGDLGKWPELQAILNQIERGGEARGGITFGAVYLVLLPAGLLLNWDEALAPAGVNTLVIALRTNPGVMHFAGTEGMHLTPGLVVWINQQAPRCAINLGETHAIHLVVDTLAASDAGGDKR